MRKLQTYRPFVCTITSITDDLLRLHVMTYYGYMWCPITATCDALLRT